MKKYQCTKVHGDKLVVICIDLDVVHCGNEVGKRIGDPLPVGGGPVTQASAQEKMAPKSVPKPMNNMQSPKPSAKVQAFGGNSGPTTPGGSATRVVPIQGLTPYQNRWTIRARVTNKGQMKEWSNSRGTGKLFSFTVSDQ